MSRTLVTSCSQTSLSKAEPSRKGLGTQPQGKPRGQAVLAGGHSCGAHGSQPGCQGRCFAPWLAVEGSRRVFSPALGQLEWVLPRTLALPGGQLACGTREELHVQLEKVGRLPPRPNVQKRLPICCAASCRSLPHPGS